jgi:hypothetical protein
MKCDSVCLLSDFVAAGFMCVGLILFTLADSQVITNNITIFLLIKKNHLNFCYLFSSRKVFFVYRIFLAGQIECVLLCLCRPFCIFERCLDWNPESCRSKQARCQLSHPSPSPSRKVHEELKHRETSPVFIRFIYVLIGNEQGFAKYFWFCSKL